MHTDLRIIIVSMAVTNDLLNNDPGLLYIVMLELYLYLVLVFLYSYLPFLAHGFQLQLCHILISIGTFLRPGCAANMGIGTVYS